MTSKPIFFDATGRRAARISLVGWIAAVVSTVLGVAFIASLLVAPQMEAVTFTNRLTAVHLPELVKKSTDPGLLRSAGRLAAEAREELAKRIEQARLRHQKIARAPRVFPQGLQPQNGRSLSIGFYETYEASSYPALKRAISHLDWVVPNWLGLHGPDMKLAIAVDRRVISLVRASRPNAAIVPMIQNVEKGVWNGDGLTALLNDTKRRTDLLNQIVSFMSAHHFPALAIDFEQVPPAARESLRTFLTEMSAAFAPHGWIIVQTVPFDDDTWPYEEYANIVDYTLLMAYDEHDDSDEPGSIASQSWFEENLAKRMRVLDPQSTIIGIGNYGYDWHGTQYADSLNFQDAVLAARDSEADIDFDDATGNAHFSYIENDKSRHEVWFLDAVTAFNQVHAADIYRPAGYALWRIGSEDPSVWPVMGRPYGAAAPDSLRTIPTSQDVDFEGAGEILRVESHPTPGARKFEVDPDTGAITDETYATIPTSYVIQTVGQVPGKIALTFDDGPDPEWTPAILDILKEKHVKATFFVIGENAEANPGLITRIISEGHELGNHTFTHPNLADTPDAGVALELNATQRLIEAITGHSMRLFRPPYLGDAEPASGDEIAPVEIAQNLGYITVGEHADTEDWQLPPPETMIATTMSEIKNPNSEFRGNIVLLHDSGGDRSRTVQVLGPLIDRLRAEHYKIVPVSELAGLSRDQVMPPLSPTVALMTDRVVFLTLSWLGWAFYVCFLIAIALGVTRLVVLSFLAFWNRERAARTVPPQPDPYSLPVSVLIPAYNEEVVIVTTVERILASDYPGLEVIVVDDGSRDNTAGVLQKRFGRDPRVSITKIPNGGKANALNVGLARAGGSIVVALDADTQFRHDTISRLARWFVDPAVGAVAGNAKVGNRINMITRWQALEYIVAQNLERRALSALGTLTVVPGAVGAWRRDALVKLGGFPADTLAEDQDLTIAVQRAGHRVLFDSSAIAWTEAPATVRGLARQRFRWAYGTLQCLWKYRDVTFNPRYRALGLVALPQVWLFQIILSALAPLVDLAFIWQIFVATMNYLQHGAEFNSANVQKIAIYYCVFMVVDLLAAMVGFVMEKREDWSLLWWLMLQRFGYRQIMYYVVLRSIFAALRGPFVGWGKLERAGTVNAEAV
jgi:cellulose synthase/poly-beta-1,6-N-acetylglucosamine synthase-like glycosyltransferase/peptidoglycan/xylan/chitin deacetylase (PgdA/CDA1 family)/spore germination protein YaaH